MTLSHTHTYEDFSYSCMLLTNLYVANCARLYLLLLKYIYII
jgi:hypothetical protein